MESRPDRGDGRFVLGLDLGQAADFTALAIGEIVDRNPVRIFLGHLRRFPLNTPYPVQVDGVAKEVERMKERGQLIVVVDQTGVGRPVVDLFRAARMGVVLWPVTIATSAMGAARRNPETHDWTVPKKDIIGALMSCAHAGRLEISPKLPDARVLKKEMLDYRMKINTNANLEFDVWREGAHDDLLFAAGFVCWAANRWASPGGLL